LNDSDSKVFEVLGKPAAVCVGNLLPGFDRPVTELYFPKRGLEVRVSPQTTSAIVIVISVSTNLEKTLADRPRRGSAYRTCTPNGTVFFEAPKNFYFTDRGLGLGATVQALIAAHGAPQAVRPYGVGRAQSYYYPGITFSFWNGALLEIVVRDPAFRYYR